MLIDINRVDEESNVLHEEHMSDYRGLSKDDFLRGQMIGKILFCGAEGS